jgi:hypothetical protein
VAGNRLLWRITVRHTRWYDAAIADWNASPRADADGDARIPARLDSGGARRREHRGNVRRRFR